MKKRKAKRILTPEDMKKRKAKKILTPEEKLAATKAYQKAYQKAYNAKKSLEPGYKEARNARDKLWREKVGKEELNRMNRLRPGYQSEATKATSAKWVANNRERVNELARESYHRRKKN
tara:strand:- start:82 stop:438 length:357 start_codon:yes stop_codon:yes gene_type:complete